MEKEFIPGLMGLHTQGLFIWTEKRDMVFLNSLMAINLR
jgi:hypothetical protein